MTCPICTRQTQPAYKPFCSRRCADVDLGRWLTGGYAIPVENDGDDGTDAPHDPPTDNEGKPH